MIDIIIRRYKEQSQAAQRCFEAFERTGNQIDRESWHAHLEQWWELREALEEYGYSPIECDKMEIEALESM